MSAKCTLSVKKKVQTMWYSIFEKTAEIQRAHITGCFDYIIAFREKEEENGGLTWKYICFSRTEIERWNIFFLIHWQSHFTFITEKWQFPRTWNRFLVCACLSVWWCRAVSLLSCAFSFRCIQMMCTEQRHEGIRLNSWVQSHSATPQRPQPEKTQHVMTNKPMRRVEQEEPAGSNQSSDFKIRLLRTLVKPA